jgi:hypothetical protein
VLKDEIERGKKLMGVTSVDQSDRQMLRWRSERTCSAE